MKYCPTCDIYLEGKLNTCPICHEETIGDGTGNPYPHVPHKFDFRKIFRALFLLSLIVITGFLILDFLFWRDQSGTFQLVSLSILALWLGTMVILRKKRNIVKSMLYLLVIFMGFALYGDYITGWNGWSLRYLLPLLCIFLLLAMVIAVRLIHLSLNDTILYLLAGAIISTLPGILHLMGFIIQPQLAYISNIMGFGLLLYILVKYNKKIKTEFQKRFRI